MARRSGFKVKAGGKVKGRSAIRGGLKGRGGDNPSSNTGRGQGAAAQGAARGPRGGRLGAMKPKSVFAAAKKAYKGGSK